MCPPADPGPPHEAGGSAGPDPVITTQALYYVATGVWPFISPGTFQAVTGPKVDMWLVKTFGGLVGAVGLTLARGAGSGSARREMRFLALASATAMGAADVWYVARGRIARTYLLDAAAQAALVAGLLLEKRRGG